MMFIDFLKTTLEPLSEACIAALDHKTPSVKAETAAFLARCFAKCTPVTLPKKLLKSFAAALLKVG
jgi:cytoskeleton-associated protein 5